MDLDNVDPELIMARGKYATCNGEYKTLMSQMQSITQGAADCLRLGLQSNNLEAALDYFGTAERMSAKLQESAKIAAELKAQKDELYRAAWGK